MLSGHTIVVYEVALSLSRLVRTHPQELHPLEWDAIYDIMNCIQSHMTQIQAVSGHTHPSNSLEQCMGELFAAIERLYEEGANIGTSEQFFSLVEANIASMPVSLLTAIYNGQKKFQLFPLVCSHVVHYYYSVLLHVYALYGLRPVLNCLGRGHRGVASS